MYKFYYIDERTYDGESTMQFIDGEAHAVVFWHLAEEVKQQSHWNYTFVKGEGYVRNEAAMPNRELRGAGPSGFSEGGVRLEELLSMEKKCPDLLKATFQER